MLNVDRNNNLDDESPTNITRYTTGGQFYHLQGTWFYCVYKYFYILWNKTECFPLKADA